MKYSFFVLVALAHLCLTGCKFLPTKQNLNTEPAIVAAAEYETLPKECTISHREYDEILVEQGPDLWDRIRDGYALPEISNKRVKQELRWYAKHPTYMDRVAKRGERYLFHIVDEIDKRGMPMEIALLPHSGKRF